MKKAFLYFHYLLLRPIIINRFLKIFTSDKGSGAPNGGPYSGSI